MPPKKKATKSSVLTEDVVQESNELEKPIKGKKPGQATKRTLTNGESSPRSGSDEEAKSVNGESSPKVNGSSPPAKKSKRNASGKAEAAHDNVNEDSEPRRKRGVRPSAETIPEDEELSIDPVKSVQAKPVVTGVKRGRRPFASLKDENPAKKIKLSFRHSRGWGQVLTVGQGDTGQLGLGEDVMEAGRPAPVTHIDQAVDAVAGGMHTAVLDKQGVVWTFGCNDEGSLGRVVEEEEDCFVPGKVDIPECVVMLSAGDSHTAALADTGQVYVWGTFRDSSGHIGLVDSMKIEKTPVKVLVGNHIVKIVSGSDHLVMLGSDGQIWTMGNSEQGQLGRINEKFAHRGGRRGLLALLKPEPVRINFRSQVKSFSDVWAGSYNTVARTDAGQIMVMGLNNYSQLALPVSKGLSFFMPHHAKELTKHSWSTVAIGQHHAICLEQEQGEVFALGRQEYGRLGLGEEGSDATVPTRVDQLSRCIEVACGTAVSYAITEQGDCLSWGMGTNGQLGTGEEEDVYEPSKMVGKYLKGKKVLVVSSGGQHTVMIAK